MQLNMPKLTAAPTCMGWIKLKRSRCGYSRRGASGCEKGFTVFFGVCVLKTVLQSSDEAHGKDNSDGSASQDHGLEAVQDGVYVLGEACTISTS